MGINPSLLCSPHVRCSSADTESSPVCVPAATPSAVTVPEEPPATEVISEGDLEVNRAVDLRPQQTTPDPRFGTEVGAQEEVCQTG